MTATRPLRKVSLADAAGSTEPASPICLEADGSDESLRDSSPASLRDSSHASLRDGEAFAADTSPRGVPPLAIYEPPGESPSQLDDSGQAGSSQATEILSANVGDHPLVHKMLLAVYQRPTAAEFQAAIDEPTYEPHDRLLLKRDGQIAAHLLMVRRQMQMGEVQLPVAEVQWLATLPEYRGAGYTAGLLAEAEQQMHADGAVLALLRTRQPESFARLGWAPCARTAWVRANASLVLAQFAAPRARRTPTLRREPAVTTRVWRHVELRPLMQIYAENVRRWQGPTGRNEVYWQWLISRRGYTQILVAIEGDDTLEFGDEAPRIVGYAVMQQNRIVELLTREGHESAAPRLLARACREAIEEDHNDLLITAPLHPQLHEPLTAAGATRCEPRNVAGEVTVAKVLDPVHLVRRLYPLLHARARTARLPRPCTLDLKIDGKAQRLVLTRRSARLEAGEALEASQASPPELTCGSGQFTQLLLGSLDPAQHDGEPAGAGRLRIGAGAARDKVEALMPRVPLWRPPFDELQA